MRDKTIDPRTIKLKGFNGLAIETTDPIDNSKGQPMSNVEWLKYVCEYSHPVTQAFVLQAIRTFADRVIADEKELLEEERKIKEEGKFQFMSNELWVEIAKYLRLSYHYQYETKRKDNQ